MINVDINFTGMLELQARLRSRPAIMKRGLVSALNGTAYDVRDALQAEMKTAFDRPVPYTLNSMYVQHATPDNLVATILPKDSAGKGTPARKYLGPEIFGGERNSKRTENALRIFGVLPAGMYTAPGKAASMDAYGNQAKGELQQIRSYFGAAKTHMGYDANSTDKTRARLGKYKKKKGTFGFSYFVIRSNQGNLKPGIYRKYNVPGSVSVIRPILMFVKKPTYSKRYRWNEVASLTARQRFERHLAAELARHVR
jgi:hypothetical protein